MLSRPGPGSPHRVSMLRTRPLAQPNDEAFLDLVGRRIRKAAAEVLPHDLLARGEELERQPIAFRCFVGGRVTHGPTLAHRHRPRRLAVTRRWSRSVW